MTRRTALAWAATSTRLVVGAALAAGIVLVVGIGVAAPWPTREQEPVAVAVVPTPADTVLACAGPLMVLARDSSEAGGLTEAAPSAVVSGSAGEPLDASLLGTNPAVAGGEGPAVLVAPPQGDRRSDAVAAGSSAVDAEDLRGLAASACRAPLIESWLVGGATTTGAADLILLANPSDVAATVDLTLYGATGASVPPGGTALRVDAHSQRIVPLAGLGVGEGAPVVRVTASGAPVAAALQSNITRTLLPGGVDQVGPVVGAEPTVVIPGVRVLPTAVEAAPSGSTTLLRLLSAGVDTSVTVTAVDADGREVLRQEAPVLADVPSEIDLAGLEAGVYSVAVEADDPVAAAVWQTTGLGEGADFAWYTPAPVLSAETLVAVPEGPDPRIMFVGTGAAAGQVVLEPLRGGAATRATVAANGTAVVSVDAGTVYRLTTEQPIRAAVTFAADGALAGFPVWAAESAAAEITVYP